VTKESLAGQKVILNIFPSIDTPRAPPASARSTRRPAEREGTTVLCVSQDLPFAMGRFCGAEGIENVKVASGFRSDFAEAFGLKLEDGPLRGLAARAIVVLDEQGNVAHTQLVGEIADEPDYDAALAALG
jgi:thiol peroxidase